MIIEDDRTARQRVTHQYAVMGIDRFLSGWGEATEGLSRCAWACDPDVNINRVESNIKDRSDMQRVRIVDLKTYKPPQNTAHFHIYVLDKNHRYATL